METWVRVPAQQAGALAALRGFLADLLRKDLVDALLVPRPAPGGDNRVQALVDTAEALAEADPAAPVMPVQSARLVSALTAGGGCRLGAVLKPCEVRATIELAKLKQVDLRRVLLVGVDCLGTYEVADYAALVSAGADLTAFALANAAAGSVTPVAGAEFRRACCICEHPAAEGCGIVVGLLGLGGEVLISAPPEVLARLDYGQVQPPVGRAAALDALLAERAALRDRVLGEWRARVKDPAALLAEFSRCVRCHNCMVNCPICYCRECLFRTATFEHGPEQYQGWLRRRGGVRLPADTLLFHLTRLNHMAACCVGCGLCASACPSHLPVDTIFRAVGREVQALFDYVPGRSLDDELPLATFREDELPGVAR